MQIAFEKSKIEKYLYMAVSGELQFSTGVINTGFAGQQVKYSEDSQSPSCRPAV